MIIRNYKLFLESNSKFSIYDYQEYLKKISWNENINELEFKEHIEHFIGIGQWDVINTHFQKIFDSLDNVDIEYINDRLGDIFDDYIEFDLSYTIRCILYGDYDFLDRDNQHRYNGMMSVKEVNNNKKLIIICEFLKSLLSDVLWLRTFNDRITSRITDDEKYVTSDYWSIKNLSKQILEIEKRDVESEYSKTKFLKFKEGFSIDKYLDMYKPGIYITIGSKEFMGNKMSHNKIKKEFENILPSILHDLDYEEVIWGSKLPTDMEDIEIYEYDFKILLKM
jgi:hypothetical protein